MTTSHKPTYHPAIGSAHSGGFRYHAPRRQVAVGQLPAHTKLKIRQVGQNAPEELAVRDLKAELQERERIHYDKINLDRKRQGLLPYAEQTRTPAAITEGSSRKRPREDDKEDGGGGGTDPSAGSESPEGEGGGGEEDAAPAPDLATAMKAVDWSKIDDADESAGEEPQDDDDDDDEDEEAELRRELEKIKKEREEERLRKEAEEAAEKAGNEEEQALRGNPLLLQDTFVAARRWDEDVVFRNQSRGEIKHKKRFVNDTIRSDFHRNFLRKYIQ